MLRSIRWKLAGTYLILIILTITVLTLVMLYPMQEYYLNFLDETLLAQARLVRQLVENDSLEDAGLQQEVSSWAEDIALRITVINARGEVMADSHGDPANMENHRNRPEMMAALQGKTGQATRFSTTLNRRLKYVALPVRENGKITGVARIAMPVSDVSAILARIKGILAVAIGTALFVGLVVSFKLSTTLTQPVEEITRVAGKIAEGNFDERFYPRTDDEIAVLGRTINYTAEILKEKVNEIQQHRSRLETVLDNMVSGVIMLNNYGGIEMINNAARQELGLDDRSVGRHNLEAIRNHRLNEKIKHVLATGAVTSIEVTLLQAPNRVFLVHLAPIDRHNHREGVIAVFHDITQLRQLEQMRKDFVANVSHELKTPLTSISGFVETMLDDPEMDPETRKKFLQIMAKETGRLNNLIDDLLELTRIESGKAYNVQQSVNLSEVVREVVEAMRPQAEAKGLELHMALGQGLKVRGSGSGLAQVVINLLDNAIKYTAAGGRISVTGYTRDNNVFVVIQDTGVGIPREELGRVFERFYRVDKARSRKLGGTGLGLAIVKHIVENHHGSIKVDSAPGAGSTFTLKFKKA